MTIIYDRLLLLLLFVVACGCSGQQFQAATKAEKVSNNTVSGEKVELYQEKLINTAYDTAMAIPVDPFIKVRSSNLEKVVDACLSLNMVEKAVSYTENIPDWRKGNCLGKIAVYYARQNDVDNAVKYIELAQQYYDSTQQWRNDQINVKLAQAYAWLGDYEKAKSICSEFEQESLAVEVTTIKILSEYCSFDDGTKEIDNYLSKGKYLPVMDSLSAYIKLYSQYYNQKDRRESIEAKVKSGFDTIAHLYRYRFLEDLCEIALNNDDLAKAHQFTTEIREVIDSVKWRLEDEVTLRAELVSLQYRSGQSDKAKDDLVKINNMLETNLTSIIDIYRATPARSIAKAYNVVGDQNQSWIIWQKAIELGMVNINLRPRAEDLVQTCCDMATNKIEPDATVWNNIDKAYKEICK